MRGPPNEVGFKYLNCPFQAQGSSLLKNISRMDLWREYNIALDFFLRHKKRKLLSSRQIPALAAFSPTKILAALFPR